MSSVQAEAAGIAGQPVIPPAGKAKERLLSLDVFRGFTLLGMVLVNSHPGGIYPGLGHARWNGWGFADLIFPFFVFIVGVAVPYSFANRLARGESPRKLLRHIVIRCVLLFAIGVFLNGYPRFDLATLRVMNVLHKPARQFSSPGNHADGSAGWGVPADGAACIREGGPHVLLRGHSQNLTVYMRSNTAAPGGRGLPKESEYKRI